MIIIYLQGKDILSITLEKGWLNGKIGLIVVSSNER